MQLKVFAVLATFVAAAVAVPSEVKRDDAAVDAEAATTSLTTYFTTETFTASQIKQSMMTHSPWVTMITSQTVWSVAHTVTRAVPAPTA